MAVSPIWCHEFLGTTRTGADDSLARGWRLPQAARRPPARGPGVPQHLFRRHVEPRVPDRLSPLQRARGRGLRTGVPAAQAGARRDDPDRGSPVRARVADRRRRLRRARLLRVVRVGLSQRPDDAAPRRPAAALRGPGRPPPARRPRRRHQLPESRTARAVCRRGLRRRGGSPRAGAGGRGQSRRRPRRGPASPRGTTGHVRPVTRRRPVPRGRASGQVRAGRRVGRVRAGDEGRAPRGGPGRSAGHDGLLTRHRVRVPVPGGGGSRLRQSLPLLLGRVQLPARPVVRRRPHSSPGRGGAAARVPRGPRVDRAVRPPGDRADPRPASRAGLPHQPGLAPARRHHRAHRPPAARERRADDHDRARDRVGPPPTGDQQDGHQRRHPGPGRPGVRLGHREPEALLHDRLAHRDRGRPGGHPGPDPPPAGDRCCGTPGAAAPSAASWPA